MSKSTTKHRHRLGIRHGDNVKVMAGRSKGKTGKVLTVNPVKAHGNGRAREHHQEAYAAEPVEECARRNSGQGRPHSRFERDAGLPGMRQAHPRGAHHAAGWHQGAGLPALQHDV